MMSDNKDLEYLMSICKEMLTQGCDLEEILSFLRQNGCSKVYSIRMLTKLKGINLQEAKRIVHFSKTWEDVREEDEEFHDRIQREIDKDKQ